MKMKTNKVYEMDAIEFLKQIDNKIVDLILCDLPYGTTSCKWDSVIPLDKLWLEYKRIIKDKGVIVLTAQTPFDKVLGASNLNMLRYEWIWCKTVSLGFMNAKKMPLKQHENILVFYNKQPTYNPQYLQPYGRKIIQKYRTDKSVYGKMGILRRIGKSYTQENTNFPNSVLVIENEKGLHPTQKPIELFEYLIRTYTNEGDLVVDNCVGSGTTAIACQRNNRIFMCCDDNPKYVKISNQRLKQKTVSGFNFSEKKKSLISDDIIINRRLKR